MKRLPKHPTPPGEMLLEEFLKPLGIPQVAFARHVGISFRRLSTSRPVSSNSSSVL